MSGSALALMLAVGVDAELKFLFAALAVASVQDARRLIDAKHSAESSAEDHSVILFVLHDILGGRHLAGGRCGRRSGGRLAGGRRLGRRMERRIRREGDGLGHSSIFFNFGRSGAAGQTGHSCRCRGLDVVDLSRLVDDGAQSGAAVGLHSRYDGGKDLFRAHHDGRNAEGFALGTRWPGGSRIGRQVGLEDGRDDLGRRTVEEDVETGRVDGFAALRFEGELARRSHSDRSVGCERRAGLDGRSRRHQAGLQNVAHHFDSSSAFFRSLGRHDPSGHRVGRNDPSSDGSRSDAGRIDDGRRIVGLNHNRLVAVDDVGPDDFIFSLDGGDRLNGGQL